MIFYSSDENKSCPDCAIFGIHCGEEQCEPGHFFGPHIRDHYLIHYVESGKGIFEMNGKSYEIGGGEIFFIVPNIMSYYCADKKDPWVYKWVGISGKRVKEIFEKAGLSEKTPVARVGKNVENAVDKLLAAAKSGNDPQLRLAACAYELLDELVKNNGYSGEDKNMGKRYVESSIGYIHRYVYKKVTVEELAETVNVDRSYLTVLFKKYIGMSPKQYILKTKMKTACEYLESTDYDVGQIAGSVGYDDLFVFSRAFKRTIGISPTEYRENIKVR